MRALRWAQVVAASVAMLFSGELRGADDPQTKGQATEQEQIWEGTLKVRPGFELRLVIHARTDRRWRAPRHAR